MKKHTLVLEGMDYCTAAVLPAALLYLQGAMEKLLLTRTLPNLLLINTCPFSGQTALTDLVDQEPED
jgi:hypothetical protein